MGITALSGATALPLNGQNTGIQNFNKLNISSKIDKIFNRIALADKIVITIFATCITHKQNNKELKRKRTEQAHSVRDHKYIYTKRK